jgi:DNA invertase Pin-like site-specific DNA recombinase
MPFNDKEVKMDTLDGYIRVSSVNGREGDSYMSPSIQQDDIDRWAQQAEVAIGKVVKEEDVSGGKAIADRGLNELIKRIERGASSGIIVNHTDRFGRDELDAALAIKRIHEAGGRLIVTQQGIDSSDPGSKLSLRLYLMMGEAYLDRVKSNWDAAKRRNVEVRKLHISSKPKFGYRRKDEVEWPDRPADGRLIADQPKEVREAWKRRTIRDARLVVEPTEAEVVLMVHSLRAQGEPFANINRRAEAMLGYEVSANFATRIVGCRVYLGEAKATVKDPKKPMDPTARTVLVATDAHEAIVTPELFAAATRMENPRIPNDGSLAEQALLSGIVYCANCGGKMYIRGRGRNGKRQAFYSCAGKKRVGQEMCDHRANADVKMVDDYVVWLLSQDGSGAAEAVGSAEQDYLEAREALRLAEENLEHWMGNSTARPDTRRRMIEEADNAVSAAQARLWQLDDPGIGDAPVVQLDNRLLVYAPWGEDKEADRRTLQRYIGKVTVKRGNRWQPLSERVSVTWADGSAPKLIDA